MLVVSRTAGCGDTTVPEERPTPTWSYQPRPVLDRTYLCICVHVTCCMLESATYVTCTQTNLCTFQTTILAVLSMKQTLTCYTHGFMLMTMKYSASEIFINGLAHVSIKSHPNLPLLSGVSQVWNYNLSKQISCSFLKSRPRKGLKFCSASKNVVSFITL